MLNSKILSRNQKGFTLVEIAIVMVIIGLLIGGVLKGQGLIQNAKVKRVVKQADEMRAAVMGFYDKYSQWPGDENNAVFPPGDTSGDGDGSGQITGAEQFELFQDLQQADLISGSYNGTSDVPSHAFGDSMYLYWLNPPGPNGAGHYFRFDYLPADVCMEIDVKYDDGVYNTGDITGSTAYTSGTNVPYFYMPL